MLILAITTEVLGTSAMKLWCEKEPLQGYLFLFTAIGLSYFFLSKAISKIPMGIAYAVWEGIGITIITIIGYFFFQEKISMAKVFGLVTVIGGIYLLKAGTVNDE